MGALLAERYSQLGQRAHQELTRWLGGDIPFCFPEVLERHLHPKQLPLLFDAFWQVLPFGTGGRRGRVGYGANRINQSTVAMTIQGHCNFLKARFAQRSDLTVVIANDVRVFRDIAGAYAFLGSQDHPLYGISSRALAKLASEIYAGNGIAAFLVDPPSDSATLSTPELSFLIATLGAVGGVNMSASHNPPDDNGVKIYDEFGSQPVAPEDQQLLDIMAAVTDVQALPFAQAVKNGLIRAVPGEQHASYVRGYVDLYGSFAPPRADLPVVYTPLCGVGQDTVGDVLRAVGFPVLSPPDEAADGSFAVIPFRSPNPEVPQSTEPARAFADQNGSGIVLSSDPDADRVGCEIKLRDGSWYHFDGNQLAAILTYALMLDPAGPRRRGLVIETLVTTKLLGRIVETAGDSDIIDDLLVGFKYVADVLKKLGRDGQYQSASKTIRRRPNELVIAAEESHGVINLPHILDKDATPACMFLAGLYQRLAKQGDGQTLLDYYIHILEQLGGYDTVNRSIMMAGAAGMERKDKIMAWLRGSPPTAIGGHPILRISDYWDEAQYGPLVSDSERLPRNVVQLFTQRFVVTVRPSGTEPKLKFYCQLLPAQHGQPAQQGQGEAGARGPALLAAIRAEAEAAARAVYNDLLTPLSLRLGDVGLLLTDLIELDRKREFEEQLLPRLKAALIAGTITGRADLLAWLRAEGKTLLPGADPLPALGAPLAQVAAAWARDLPPSPGLGALLDFTGAAKVAGMSTDKTPHGSDVPRAITVIGGGTGSFNVLVGLRPHRRLRITSIVTMTDSGGDSGRLRTEYKILPPGDIRRCLVALSDESPLLCDLFNFRFEDDPLRGRQLGNLLVLALTRILGSEQDAISAIHRLLNIRGRVLPVTWDQVHLCAELADGRIIEEEANIDVPKHDPTIPIVRVFLKPAARPNPEALGAIAESDAIVLAPGDLYTSTLPNLLVPGVSEAIRNARGAPVLRRQSDDQAGRDPGLLRLETHRRDHSLRRPRARRGPGARRARAQRDGRAVPGRGRHSGRIRRSRRARAGGHRDPGAPPDVRGLAGPPRSRTNRRRPARALRRVTSDLPLPRAAGGEGVGEGAPARVAAQTPHPSPLPADGARGPEKKRSFRTCRPLRPLLHRDVGRQDRAGVDLAGPADLRGRVLDHLFPVRDPAGQAADGEHDREHVRGDAHRPVDDAAVEVDVRVQLALDEVRIRERRLLEAVGDVQQRIVLLQLRQDLVAGDLDDLGARVVVLVDAVAEAHQAEARVLLLGQLDVLLDVAAVVAGCARASRALPGWRRRAAGPTARRCRRRRDANRLACELPTMRTVEVRAVLLVVGVQDQQQVQDLHQILVDLVRLGRDREHHVQEVRAVR